MAVERVDVYLLKEEGGYLTAFLWIEGKMFKTHVHEKCEEIHMIDIIETSQHPMADTSMKSMLQAKDFTWNVASKETTSFSTELPTMITNGTIYGIFAGQLGKGAVS